MRAKDPVVNGGRLGREARLLGQGVLVRQTAHSILGHITTEALHFMFHGKVFGQELKLLCLKVDSSDLFANTRLIGSEDGHFVHLH